jgi:hypothetical protein
VVVEAAEGGAEKGYDGGMTLTLEIPEEVDSTGNPSRRLSTLGAHSKQIPLLPEEGFSCESMYRDYAQ